MKILIVSAALSCLIAPQVAFAEDGDWTGPYVGINAGVLDSSTQNVDTWCWGACDGPEVRTVKPTIGMTVGINQQVDRNLIVGLEADISTGAKEVIQTPTWVNATPPSETTWASDQKWSSSIRFRAGMANNRTMIYLTAGYTIAKASYSENTTNYPPFGGHPGPFGAGWRGTLTGYTYGGGVEHSFGDFSLKLEVLHSRFGEQSACYADAVGPTTGQCILSPSNQPSMLTFTPRNTTVRFGVNYRF